MMALGARNRAVAETKMNARSSRSHSVLTVIVDGVNHVTGLRTHGCLHLIDLAGAPRVRLHSRQACRRRRARERGAGRARGAARRFPQLAQSRRIVAPFGVRALPVALYSFSPSPTLAPPSPTTAPVAPTRRAPAAQAASAWAAARRPASGWRRPSTSTAA